VESGLGQFTGGIRNLAYILGIAVVGLEGSGKVHEG
jgi:hypothetical protein